MAQKCCTRWRELRQSLLSGAAWITAERSLSLIFSIFSFPLPLWFRGARSLRFNASTPACLLQPEGFNIDLSPGNVDERRDSAILRFLVFFWNIWSTAAAPSLSLSPPTERVRTWCRTGILDLTTLDLSHPARTHPLSLPPSAQ